MKFITSRSSGAGGQNVNKVETRVCLRWAPFSSRFITENQRNRLIEVLEKKIDSQGFIQICCQEKRSQIHNRHLAETKLLNLINNAIIPSAPRLSTKIPYAKKLRRAEAKKLHSQKKQNRRFRP